MPDIHEISATALKALQAAEEVRIQLSGKIASQEAEINRLNSINRGVDEFRSLVAKLASAGVVDRPNAKYLDRNVNETNVGDFIVKLANVVEAPIQVRAAMSPYEVTGVTETKTAKDDAAGTCEEKLRKIVGR